MIHPIDKARGYEIWNKSGVRGIRCLKCGFLSWNINDVKNRYCVMCHIFHEETQMAQIGDIVLVTLSEGKERPGIITGMDGTFANVFLFPDGDNDFPTTQPYHLKSLPLSDKREAGTFRLKE